jgi:hypothetical protein
LKPDPEDPSKQMPYLEDRQTLGHWGGKQIAAGTINEYRSKFNARSLDGLPGLRVARTDAGEKMWIRDLESQVRRYNGINNFIVAIVSSLFTALALYMLGLTKLPEPSFLVRN